MPLKSFLGLILPSDGYKCWTSIKKDKTVRNHFCTSIEELAEQISNSDAQGVDTYHACSSYVTNENRKGRNALGMQVFIADLDVGEGKPYATQEDAISECDEFASGLGIPNPGIVRSGSGVHAYWCLDRMLTRTEWLYHAGSLKLLMQARGFHADPSRTADIASILRPPQTHNYKLEGNPRLVTVDDFDFFERSNTDGFINRIISAGGMHSTISIPVLPVHAPSSINAALSAGIGGKVDTAAPVAEGGRNLACYKFACSALGRTIPYEDIVGLTLKYNREQCVPPLEEAEARHAANSALKQHAAKHPAPVPQELLPVLEWPYVWHEGKLSVKNTIPSGVPGMPDTVEIKPICPLPVYFASWLNEEGHKHKYSYLFKQYHPVEGWYNIVMTPEEMNSKDFYKIWVSRGGCIIDGMDKTFLKYVRKTEAPLRDTGKALPLYSQLGWKDNNKSILVGDLLVKSDGTYERAVGTTKLSPLMQLMQPAPGGSHAEWLELSKYLCAPQMETQLTGLVLSFASLLMPFCCGESEGGSIVSIVSESGKGKTPLTSAMASVWGQTASVVSSSNTTGNRHTEDLVRRRHFPQLRHEMAFDDPKFAAEDTREFTSGTSRMRLDRTGAAKEMPEYYQTIVTTISNKSYFSLVRMADEAMSKRIFELNIDETNAKVLENLGGITSRMLQHCGYAGIAAARFIVQPKIVEYLTETITGSGPDSVGATQLHYRKLLGTDASGRYLVWTLTCLDVMSRLLNAGQIMRFDTERLMDWNVAKAKQNAIDSPGLNSPLQRLTKFFTTHWANCLTVGTAFDPKRPLNVIRLPTKDIAIRFEMNPGKCYISQEALGVFCTKEGLSLNSWGRALAATGVLEERSKNFSLGLGTELPGGRSLCWVLNMEHPEMDNKLRLVLQDNLAPDKQKKV